MSKVFQQIDARVGDARLTILDGVDLSIPASKNPKRVRIEQVKGLDRAAVIIQEEKKNLSNELSSRLALGRDKKVAKAVETYQKNGVFHTIATVRLLSGGSLRRVSEILNSSDVKTTRGLDWTPENVAKVEKVMLSADISLSDCSPLPAPAVEPTTLTIEQQILKLFQESGLDSKTFQAAVKRVTDDQLDWVG